MRTISILPSMSSKERKAEASKPLGKEHSVGVATGFALEIPYSRHSPFRKMEEADLDSSLWQQLPVDLLENVLTKLPVSSLMSFSRVCKRWKNLIQSAEFACRSRSVKPFVFCHYPGDYYHSKQGRSYLAIPSEKTNSWKKHRLQFSSDPVDLVAADQGLLCFRSKSKLTRNTLFVYNPLTRRSRKVTVPGNSEVEDELLLFRGTRMLVGLMVDQERGNYKLVVGFIGKKFLDDEEPRGTHIYDSLSSTWTWTSLSPDFPPLPMEIDNEDDEDENRSYWSEWKPGVSLRSGGNLYWMVEEAPQTIWEDFFRILVRYDFSAFKWTVDEPNLPYARYVRHDDIPDCLPRDLPYACLVEPPLLPRDYKIPQWNFHLAAHDENLFVILFDSLISKDAYSGEFSTAIPEVKVIDAELVNRLLEYTDVPQLYIPTKAVAQNEMWYVVFEYEGVCSEERGTSPLLVLAYNSHQREWRWLPDLDPESSCGQVLPLDYPSCWLPEVNACAATFRAFV
ncbi:hypothetical protein R1sor_026575 [Riccia sorocarpa]|uniref:F-box domain-containing protein n=1 Tax=Riccia sorocarpa TaxID=122646 RepID=A0ABD3GEM5_9MARC